MRWANGLRRIRLLGTGALALGVLLLLAIGLIDSLGYAPNPGLPQFLFTLGARLCPLLLVLGALLWVTVWVLTGFLPAGEPPTPDSSAHLDRR